MTDLAWTATRADTIDRFNGQTPRPEDEAPIIDIFEAHPQLVMRAIDETAAALNAGKITWAWSVLNARLTRGTTALREATADTSAEKTKRVTSAETWIRNTGIHYDREDHVLAEIFGDEYSRGILTDYANDAPLRKRMVDLWQSERPRGIQAERDFEAWNAKCGAYHAQRLALARAKELQRITTDNSAQEPPDFPVDDHIDDEPEPATVAASSAGADIDFDT